MQKNIDFPPAPKLDPTRRLDPTGRLDPSKANERELAGERGLLGLVEIGVVEMHTWGATVDDIEHPDTLVFDLDPGEGVEWGFVVETAFRLRDLLAAEGLVQRF